MYKTNVIENCQCCNKPQCESSAQYIKHFESKKTLRTCTTCANKINNER